jgi:hypothetical protein
MMLRAALDYAARGWPVFPLRQRTKVPATKHGYHDATTDPERIRAWWKAMPAANIGIACGAVVVVDVDVHGDARGDRTLAELVRDRGPIGWSWSATTPSGGTHYYFAAPSGANVRRRIGWPGVGLDLLGAGGYVVAPPSRTDAGEYAWCDDGAPLATLGGWLLKLATRDEPAPDAAPVQRPARWTSDVEDRARRALDYVDQFDPAVSGQGGHAQTFRVALTVVRGFNLPLDVARVILRLYGSRCSPPWSERELEHKLASAEHARIGSGYLLGRGAT